MSKPKIIVGPSSNMLGNSLMKLINAERANLVYKTFPDGESYVRIEGIKKEDSVIVLQSLSPPQDKNLFILLQILSVLNEISVNSLIVLIPYLAYSRQDKMFIEGEAVSSKVVAKMISSYNFDKLFVVEPHSFESISPFGDKVEIINVNNAVVEFIKNKLRRNYTIVAPDKGRLERVKELSKMLNFEYAWIEKSRDRYTGEVKATIGKLPEKNSDVLIFDDIISTGGTIAEASKLLHNEGIKNVDAICVHGLFVDNAIEKMKKAGVREIYSSDTIESNFSSFSVASEISERIKRFVNEI